jgi:hypothetical protein
MARKDQVPQLKVTVTPELYQQAVEAHSARCMIAEAIKAKLGPLSNPLADMDHIRITTAPGVRVIYRTPDKARALLLKFDAGVRDIIEPISFIAKEGGLAKKRVGLNKVRQWAREQPQFEGRAIADHGLVPSDVVEAFEKTFNTRVEQGTKITVRGNGKATMDTGKPPAIGVGAGGAGRSASRISPTKRRIHGSLGLTKELLQDPVWLEQAQRFAKAAETPQQA